MTPTPKTPEQIAALRDSIRLALSRAPAHSPLLLILSSAIAETLEWTLGEMEGHPDAMVAQLISRADQVRAQEIGK